MYTVIRRYRTDARIANELIRRVQDEFVPMVSQAAGFISYSVLTESDGTTASISVFQDQASAEESTRLAREWVRDRLTDLELSPPEVTAGETPIHVTAEQGTSQTRQTRAA